MALSTEEGVRTFVARRGVTATDRLMLGFIAVNTAVIVSRAGTVASWPWLIAGNALACALVAMLARLDAARGLTRLLAGAWPVVVSVGYYTQIGVLNTDIGLVRDAVVQRWELAVFGSQVSLTWHEAMPSLVLSWVLHVAYGSYYGIVAAAVLWLFFRTDEASFRRGAFIMTLGFYACYVIDDFFPVAGPRYFFGNATGPIAEILPARLIRQLMEGGSAWGTAFPSSHIVACWCAVWALWRPARKVAMALAPLALLMALGTVYGQFHYAVDALAGAILAVLLCLVADPLRRVLAPGASS